jgi:hypothetical protein
MVQNLSMCVNLDFSKIYESIIKKRTIWMGIVFGLPIYENKITLALVVRNYHPLFSSPDTKGHVSYCHHLASVVVVRQIVNSKWQNIYVVEWSRALDARLSEWCCGVSMVWVQIPSRLLFCCWYSTMLRIWILFSYLRSSNSDTSIR